MSQSLAQLIQRIEASGPLGIHLGLDRVERLLDRVGNPQGDLNIIHVAGTNGKGSTVAFLEAVLLAAGLPVGAYTSPHLTRFNERIRLQGRDVEDAPLVLALERVLEACHGISATFFEMATVAALLLFADHGLGRHGSQPGVVLLETGLGGRLDATNVTMPLISLIGVIGMDHSEYLGHTLEAIAWEKAGIMKPGIPCVTACGSGPVLEVLKGRARDLNTPLFYPGRDYAFRLQPHARDWIFEDDFGTLHLPELGLRGGHQRQNASLAIKALGLLQRQGWPISPQAMATGCRTVRWPGRMETIEGQPSIVLDGAHNPQAMEALVLALAEEEGGANLFRTVVFSALADKDLRAMVRILAPHVRQVVVTAVGGARGCTVEVLVRMWQEFGLEVQGCPSPHLALALARKITPLHGQLLITGSLYLVGELRSLLI